MDKYHMHNPIIALLRVPAVAALLATAAAAGAATTPVATPIAERFPAGSITSEQAAAAALAQASADRQELQIQYVLDQRVCYAKFLVSSCLEAARDRKRELEKSIKQVEIEANTYRRQAQVDERDQSLAEQHARDQAESARRLQDQQDKQAATARHVQQSDGKRAEVQQRIDQAPPPDARIRAHDARVAEQQADEAARAPQRAANAAARQQRIKDAEQHRQDVERKKAERERERAEKQRNNQP